MNQNALVGNFNFGSLAHTKCQKRNQRTSKKTLRCNICNVRACNNINATTTWNVTSTQTYWRIQNDYSSLNPKSILVKLRINDIKAVCERRIITALDVTSHHDHGQHICLNWAFCQKVRQIRKLTYSTRVSKWGFLVCIWDIHCTYST